MFQITKLLSSKIMNCVLILTTDMGSYYYILVKHFLQWTQNAMSNKTKNKSKCLEIEIKDKAQPKYIFF